MIKKYPILKKLPPFIFLFFSVIAFSQITQRGVATTGTSTNSGLTIPKPAGIAVGDIMLANIAQGFHNNSDKINPTSLGWTLISSEYLGDKKNNRESKGSVLYKIATADDVDAKVKNYTFVLDDDNKSAVGAIVAFSGVDIMSPFDVTPGSINADDSKIVTAKSVTTVTANAAIIMLAQVGNDRSYTNWETTNSPDELEEIYDEEYDDDGGVSVGGAWATKATLGATGEGTANLSNNDEERNGGILLALRPYIDPNTSTEIFTTPGTSTFTVPSCVSSLTIQAWGGGASGGTDDKKDSKDSRGGGGGGGYVTNTYLDVTAGETIVIKVGAGGIITDAKKDKPGVNGGNSSYDYSGLVTAGGGKAGGEKDLNPDKGGAGGAISGDSGSGSKKGGDGADRVDGKDKEGGGGGGSGPGASNANRQSGGNPGGGDGGDKESAGNNGDAPGGGGGGKGGESDKTQSGNGANGQVIITWKSGNNTWNGSKNKDWNNDANWCVGVPTIGFPNTLDVVIPSGLTNYPIIYAGDDPGYVKTIVFKNKTTLNVKENSLQVTHNLNLNESSKIDLEGESQLVQDPGSTFSGTGTIEIDQQGTGNSFRYNYWSSPVNSNFAAKKYSIGAVLKDGTDPNNLKDINYDSPYAFADGDVTSPIKLSSYWIYKLENSKGYAAWFRVGNTGEMSVGEGYSMKGSNTSATEQNYTFVGKPNNGIIELDVNAGNDYLVGNPYPSAIDATQFLIDNGPAGTGIIGDGGALHFWEHYGGDTHNLAGYQAGYATRNLLDGVPATSPSNVSSVVPLGVIKKVPGPYIAVGQAFFVVGDFGGKIQFNNGQRVFVKESQLGTNGDPISVFMKSSNIKEKTTKTDLSDHRPKFRIGFDAPKISHRQILLGVDERATQAVDWGFDAEIYEVFADDMYWILNNKKYVIQGTNEVGLNSEVPLGIQLSKTGVVTVKIDALENVDDNTSIYLKDKLTGESFNLRDKAVQLNLTAGKYTDRFVIVFKMQKLVAEDVVAEVLIPAAAQPIIEGMLVFMNNTIKELQIKNNSNEEILNIALINSLGQTIKTWNSNFNTITISLPINSETGVYLVQINTKKGATNKKIVVN